MSGFGKRKKSKNRSPSISKSNERVSPHQEKKSSKFVCYLKRQTFGIYLLIGIFVIPPLLAMTIGNDFTLEILSIIVGVLLAISKISKAIQSNEPKIKKVTSVPITVIGEIIKLILPSRR